MMGSMEDDPLFSPKLIDFKPRKRRVGLIVAVLIVVAFSVGAYFVFGKDAQIPQLLAGIIGLIIAASLQMFAWRGLFNTLMAYGLAARIPVLIVMFLALQGHWGTHYDALPPGQEARFRDIGLIRQFINLALLPQIFLWIPFTIVVGGLFGGIAGLFAKPKNR